MFALHEMAYKKKDIVGEFYDENERLPFGWLLFFIAEDEKSSE